MLNKMGFNAAALEGGYTAWLAAYPTEPKSTEHANAPRKEQPEEPVVERV
ncbi:MAG TPA: hypothetical protein VFT66_02690 [Roseiflexaceae bacterium]|nr:hypothetical protein [Roseiflexaceae bacterium]